VGTTNKLALVGSPPEETLLRVVQILRGMVEAAGRTEDVREIKSKLADCLKSVLDEVEHRQGAAGQQPDPTTGLPDRAGAEEAILRVYAADAPACVGVLTFDSLTTLNLRFGSKVGDEILRHYAETLRQQLPSEDLLFRWGGNALMALLLRPARIEQVRREFGRLLDAGYEHTVNTPSRVVHLPVLPRWAVWPMMASPALLIQKLDAFAGVPSRPDSSGNG
jgi:diguanylate cyclase (GGDEF)-like protein